MDRYEEALERAKKGLPIDEVFPELKESEDERIRKILIHIVKGACDKYGIKYKGDDITEEKLLAYLEKQKEQKPVEGDNETEIQKAFREGKSAGRQEVFDHPEEYGLQKEQKPAEWSEEDERTLESFLGWLQGSMGEKTYSSWLKSLPERFSLKPKQEWSEEDKHCIHQLILFCENCMQQDSEAIRCATWLKSLRPQPHWKPSDVQMEALAWYSGNSGVPPTGDKAIKSLYIDLQKLL